MKARHWTVIKLIVTALMAYCLAFGSVESHITVLGALLIGSVVFLALSAWLFALQGRAEPGIDWTLSISGRFWPMRRHPFQYWALFGVMMILGGAARILRAVILGHGNIGDGVVFCSLGGAAALAIFFNLARRPKR